MSRYKDLEQLLTRKQINPTAMRLLVLEELLGQKNALSLSELEKRMAPADRITIYRTLKTFEQKGLVHSIADGSAAPKFSLCEDSCNHLRHQDAHAHFVCRQCHQTICLPDSTIPPLSVSDSFVLDSVMVVAKGLCPDCRC